jgi:hypothetical protein
METCIAAGKDEKCVSSEELAIIKSMADSQQGASLH